MPATRSTTSQKTVVGPSAVPASVRILEYKRKKDRQHAETIGKTVLGLTNAVTNATTELQKLKDSLEASGSAQSINPEVSENDTSGGMHDVDEKMLLRAEKESALEELEALKAQIASHKIKAEADQKVIDRFRKSKTSLQNDVTRYKKTHDEMLAQLAELEAIRTTYNQEINDGRTRHKCPICLERVTSEVEEFWALSPCHHIYCGDCINGIENAHPPFGKKCPVCKVRIEDEPIQIFM